MLGCWPGADIRRVNGGAEEGEESCWPLSKKVYTLDRDLSTNSYIHTRVELTCLKGEFCEGGDELVLGFVFFLFFPFQMLNILVCVITCVRHLHSVGGF